MDPLSREGRVHRELNYLVRESVALRLRDFVRQYLDLNEYSVAQPNFSFPVHSLYLDSPALDLYRQARNDIEHRCHLRVRFHDERPDSPVFLEIKRRAVDVVTRQRCAVRRQALAFVLNGQLPPVELFLRPTAQAMQAAQDFVKLQQTHRAQPQLRLSFVREGYVGDNEAVQVTFDRQVVFEPCQDASLRCALGAPRRLFAPHVVFELNFVERFPRWFQEMVQHFNLTECGVDKYVGAMASLRHDDLTRTIRGPS